MSSNLAKILSCVDKVEVEHLKSKGFGVEWSVIKRKMDILRFLEDTYVRFKDRPRENNDLACKIESLQDDNGELTGSIENDFNDDLSSSKIKMERLSMSFLYTKIGLKIVSTLLNIHQLLEKVKVLRQQKSYLLCMQKIKETEQLFASLNPKYDLPIIEGLKCGLLPEKIILLLTLLEDFHSKVILQEDDTQSVIKIKKDQEKIETILRVLFLDNTSVAQLDNISNFLWNHIFVPIVDLRTIIKETTDGEFNTLTVVIDPGSRASYSVVFANIKLVLKFLSANFNMNLSDQLSTLTYIGDHIRDNLSELIIKHCLEDKIPCRSEDLQEYQVVMDATEDLENALLECGIFQTDTTSIMDCANNILFINKKCQKYVLAARSIMEKDLQDLIEVGSSEVSGKVTESRKFQRFSVSRSVKHLIQLLEKLIKETKMTLDIYAGRLLTTAKTIAYTYAVFVPKHHKKLLQTVPQQIAVFYNNCMFLSWNLAELNNTHLNHLPEAIKVYSKNFTNECIQLHQAASNIFSSYIHFQIKQIAEIIKEVGWNNKTLDQLDASTEKCIRQCLRQQEFLKTVWKKVLSYDVYNKTLGTILDSLCTQLISPIVQFEDISSQAAEQLVEVLKIVQTRGSKLFTDPKEINLFVSNWCKLNELCCVLSGSLVDIEDRWADGKGPLALQFQPTELKQLVKALFQNTEQRATLLAKIHD